MKVPKNNKLLTISTIFIIVVAILLVLYALGTFSQFKTVTYTNGVGSSFKISFYKNYLEVPEDKVDTVPGESPSKTNVLVANNDKYGKAKLVLEIDSDSNKQTENSLAQSACYSVLSTAFYVYNNNIQSNLHVCKYDSGKIPIIYTASFRYNSIAYLVTITQDNNEIQNYLNKETAHERSGILPQAGLSSYNKDIKRILSSIKVTK